MSSLNYAGPIGNIVSRLQGLKNVSGRRVMPGDEIADSLDYPEMDVEGASPPLPKFENFIPPNENLPEPDLGGSLTSQSYDVRANTAEREPQQEQNQGPLSRLGSGLKNVNNFDYFYKPNPSEQASAQENGKSALDYIYNPQARMDMVGTAENKENIPQPAPQKESMGDLRQLNNVLSNAASSATEYGKGLFKEYIANPLSDYLNPDQRNTSQEDQDRLIDLSLEAQNLDPALIRQEKNMELMKGVQEAKKAPWVHSAYGSAFEVANHPALQQEFKEITGIDYTPQIAATTAQFEKSMKGVEDALNGSNKQLDGQSEDIKNRILNNQMTDSDKFYIGLALLMPLIVGGLFGKEAGFGALSGTAKGYVDILGKREKNIREDEAALMKLGEQKTGNLEKLANISLQKAKLPGEIQKNLPEDKTKHLIGLEKASWIDPKTGKEEGVVEILPGLVAKSGLVQTERGLARMEKAAEELAGTKSYVSNIDSLTNDAIEIANQLEDKNGFLKYAIGAFQGSAPGSLGKFTQDVMYQGRMQNAGVLLESILGQLANQYGHAQDIGQLDRAAQQHIKKIVENPTATLLSPENAISQLLLVRNTAQEGLVNQAKNKGFVPEFVISDLEEGNSELFGKLNKKNNDQRVEERKRQVY